MKRVLILAFLLLSFGHVFAAAKMCRNDFCNWHRAVHYIQCHDNVPLAVMLAASPRLVGIYTKTHAKIFKSFSRFYTLYEFAFDCGNTEAMLLIFAYQRALGCSDVGKELINDLGSYSS
ncbi:hypothetical protein K2X40_00145 [Candidatus Babeliales bacterium]|nr:hypothetical protein [Candidatus Babeliales bacterium]